ncbi:hypothetical protein [Mycolicibacterium farcinogenes]|uniref:Uncharacterized protein n=1 Tax=Mycolicibacterium farcinogenes TaxID=1802 RepID=A0ACD1FI93_MYCFR|nr:hypothetical protein [Mycolicibacterium farcinogenes]QZH66705.1 hypothetical protein K6L26_03160 [Mycolicibacterium farcinogenes]
MGIPTHVMEYTGGSAATMDGGAGRLQFRGPLGAMDGVENWYLTFSPLPPGQTIDDIRHGDTPEYLQAGGRADKMMLDMRRPGGEQWGVAGVRYVIGHVHEGNPPLDVAIELPHGPEYVSAPEVFTSDEATEIFYTYYKTGDIPDGYVLRPVEGYTADGRNVDLRGVATT